MNTFAILGYVVAICLAPVAPFLLHRWIGAAWQAAKALRVLSREQRTGETLYDTAEAIAGEKAGIAKAGVPLITMRYPEAVTQRVAAVAQAAGAQGVILLSDVAGLLWSNFDTRFHERTTAGSYYIIFNEC